MTKVTAYLDLLRAHFIPAWILIFTACYITAVNLYGGFDTSTLIKVILIAVFGFEAGIVLNDYVDRDLDKKDIDTSLTGYFRPFKTRPLAVGSLSANTALATVIISALICSVLILSLPAPGRYYVLAIMFYAYIVEYFYQIKKRRQSFPLAQLIGRTDFALFPVAAFLIISPLNLNAVLYFLYFYPLAEAHLAINDLADWKNDQSRKLQTIPRLYGINGTIRWIIFFSLTHIVTATIFVLAVNPAALPIFFISYLIIIFVTLYIYKNKTPKSSLQVLPLIHLSMAVQSLALIFIH